MLEEIVNFKKEISVIVCRSQKNIITYPPVENVHKDSILRETTYPAQINAKLAKDAINMAIKIAHELKLEGVLAVEMFIDNNNDILINELAPRPHNSGHWSIDFCQCSQFENLISLIFNDFVKEPLPIKKCKMINVIGKDYEKKENLIKKYQFYDYFKDEVRDLRKMVDL